MRATEDAEPDHVYRFFSFTGLVTAVDSHEVKHGSRRRGGGGDDEDSLIRTRFRMKLPSGREVEQTLPNVRIPLASGQRITLVCAGIQDVEGGYILRLINHATRKGYDYPDGARSLFDEAHPWVYLTNAWRLLLVAAMVLLLMDAWLTGVLSLGGAVVAFLGRYAIMQREFEKMKRGVEQHMWEKVERGEEPAVEAVVPDESPVELAPDPQPPMTAPRPEIAA